MSTLPVAAVPLSSFFLLTIMLEISNPLPLFETYTSIVYSAFDIIIVWCFVSVIAGVAPVSVTVYSYLPASVHSGNETLALFVVVPVSDSVKLISGIVTFSVLPGTGVALKENVSFFPTSVLKVLLM